MKHPEVVGIAGRDPYRRQLFQLGLAARIWTRRKSRISDSYRLYSNYESPLARRIVDRTDVRLHDVLEWKPGGTGVGVCGLLLVADPEASFTGLDNQQLSDIFARLSERDISMAATFDTELAELDMPEAFWQRCNMLVECEPGHDGNEQPTRWWDIDKKYLRPRGNYVRSVLSSHPDYRFIFSGMDILAALDSD